MAKELKELKIDEEFKKLIPSSTDEEYELLHASIDKYGCIDPIIVWNDCIIDGHTRYNICRLLKQPFNTEIIEFQDRDEAKLWILQHQLGKRNVSDAQKIELALKLKPLIAKQAKANQSAAGGAVPIKVSKPVDTREEVAKIAGVSPAQVSKVEHILSEGNEEDLARLRSGEPISAVHRSMKTKEENLDAIKSITKKQIDTMLKDIITKIGKMSSASDEVVRACEAQLQEIVLKLTQLLTRKKEDLSYTDSQL